MRRASPQVKFLLRGSVLLVAFLILWWFVLLDPLLSLLRGSAEMIGGSGRMISLTASGAWTFHFATGGRMIDFDLPRADVLIFTFSLPVFWAIILAAGDIRRSLRPLAIGTVIVIAMEALMLLAFAWLAARNITARMASGEADVFGAWLAHVGEYLIVSVLPYAAPFLIALALHRDLRSQILPFAAPAAAPTKKARRELRRRRKVDPQQ